MDTEEMLVEIEKEIKDFQSTFEQTATDFFSKLRDSEADLDLPIERFLDEMREMQNNLVILRAIRITIKRQMTEMRKVMVNR